MKILFQIEYERPSVSDAEWDLCGDMMNIETLSCVDLSTDKGKAFIREIFDEFLEYYHHKPETAKFWIGGVCDCHS